ncbi:MAG: polyprenyl synthetase family protein [Myxococcota bacterium]
MPNNTPFDADLYDLVREYPFREAKMLRPALAYAVCRALGGRSEAVLPTAAVLELYHNAFLIHDDIEDGSWARRDAPTLHRVAGVPLAINTGDAMLGLCLGPLLDNTALVGLGPALRVLSAIAEMSRRSAEGQAIELGWIRRGQWQLSARDYLRMVHRKTTWYTFLTPIRVGGILAGVPEQRLSSLLRWATLMGAAFQITDDVLNLEGTAASYGKEIAGDLWEGKRTLIVLHFLRHATPSERDQALSILTAPRPEDPNRDHSKQHWDQIHWLHNRIREAGSISYAKEQARLRAIRARRAFDSATSSLHRVPATTSVHWDFLAGLTAYVVARTR